MKKFFTFIVSVITTVFMIGTVSVNAAAEGAENVAKLVTEAKMVADNPAITSLGPIEIDGTTWRYTVKSVNGDVHVDIYEWTGLESLTKPLSEALA